MILQEEIVTLVDAFNANPSGALFFYFLVAFLGMMIVYIAMPSMRNKKVMGMLLFLMLAGSLIGAVVIWPEFWTVVSKDPTMLVTGAAALVIGPLAIPIILTIIIYLVFNIIGGRGIMGRG